MKPGEIVIMPDQDISEFIQMVPQLIMWGCIIAILLMWADEKIKSN